jgi:pilus assembly protein FimV
MKHAVRSVLLTSALIAPTTLFALGLGEIRLNSALNQPFDAEIELVSATAEDLASLRAALASSDTFSRYGLDRAGFLSDFTFRVTRGSGGKDVLRVSSPRPVTEPFVTLLVEANWSRGRLLREYTVLLDPPVFTPPTERPEAPMATPQASAPALVPAPVRREPVEQVATEPARPEAPAAAAPRRMSAPSPTLQAGQTYVVRPNDTLWQIANQVNPGSNSNVNRAMVAIYQANPGSFDGNINVLRSGSTLRIPGQSELSAISASAAAEEVARQYRLWQEGSTVAATEGADAGRLRLVTPEQGTPAASTATTSKPAAAQQAAAADQAVLQSRVQQLEAELAEARRLLEVRNAELATLQGQTAAGPPAAAEGTVPSAPEAGAAPTEAGQVVAEEPAAAAPAAEPAAQAPEEPAKKPAAKPKPKPKAVPEEPSFIDGLMDYWWAFAGLLAAGLAGAWFYRRRRSEPDTDAALEQSFSERDATDLRARSSTPARSREAQIVVEEKRPVEPTPVVARAATAAVAASAVSQPPEPTRKPVSIEDTIQTQGPLDVGSGDPLAEADFHMAYGLYDQAADLIQLAIRREPVRRELKLKLLEIYFVWGNRDKFLEVAREMNATRADALPGEWDKVLIMGKQIAADDAMFAGAARTSVSDLDVDLQGGDRALDFDLDLQGDEVADLDLGETTPAVSGGEAELDFVLDEPVRGADDYPSQAATVETPALDRGATVRMSSLEATEELPIESLGLDSGDLETLSGLENVEDMLQTHPRTLVENTAENRLIAEETLQDAAEDLLSSTSIMKGGTGTLPVLSAEEIADATGELTAIQEPAPGIEPAFGGVDFLVDGEAATMSEVGTKLDLARAYIDMGDPEGARSILDEVVGEGNPKQKQEAQRLIATLP